MKKNILIASLLMAALSLTACSSVENPSTTTTNVKDSGSVSDSDSASDASDAADLYDEILNVPFTELVVPETDKEGNKIEVIQVTDAAGAAVKDEFENPVTELAIVDDKGTIVTDAQGQNVKPNVELTPVSRSSLAFLWFGNTKSVNGKTLFQEITEDGDVIELTFKVKDNAPEGVYDISHLSDAGHSSSFCDQDVESLDIQYCTGYISVGRDAKESEPGSGLSFVVSSAQAKAGDTVTLKCSLKNVSKGIVAFNSYFKYDDNALELVSINALDSISSKGEFTTSMK